MYGKHKRRISNLILGLKGLKPIGCEVFNAVLFTLVKKALKFSEEENEKWDLPGFCASKTGLIVNCKVFVFAPTKG